MRWRPPGGATGERRYRRKAFRSAKGGTTKSPPNDRKYSARWRWHSLPRNRTGRCTRPSSGARRWTGSAPSGRGWLPSGLTDAPWPGSSPGGPPVGMRTSSGISRFEAVERVRRAAQQMLARLQGLRADGLGEGGQGRPKGSGLHHPGIELSGRWISRQLSYGSEYADLFLRRSESAHALYATVAYVGAAGD